MKYKLARLLILIVMAILIAMLVQNQLGRYMCFRHLYLSISGKKTYVWYICYAKIDKLPATVTIQPVNNIGKNLILAKMSHYYPPLGGANCASFVNGYCVSTMANGERWEDNIDIACACPAEYPFGTVFVVNGKEWVCKDRGGKIITQDGVIWLDMLTQNPIVPYGNILEVEVR